MDIEIGEELKLSKFRKILNLLSKTSVFKVSLNGQLYDISKIMDRGDVLIFQADKEKPS